MPYRSEKQRRFMHARHPEIAARWDAEYGGQIVPSGKEHAKRHKRHKKRHKRHHGDGLMGALSRG